LSRTTTPSPTTVDSDVYSSLLAAISAGSIAAVGLPATGPSAVEPGELSSLAARLLLGTAVPSPGVSSGEGGGVC